MRHGRGRIEESPHQKEAYRKTWEAFDPDEEGREGEDESAGIGHDTGKNSSEGEGKAMNVEREGQGTAEGKAMMAPRAPSQREWADHRATHWPYRDGCEHCVRGPAKSNPHREVHRASAVPILGIHYTWMTGADEE